MITVVAAGDGTGVGIAAVVDCQRAFYPNYITIAHSRSQIAVDSMAVEVQCDGLAGGDIQVDIRLCSSDVIRQGETAAVLHGGVEACPRHGKGRADRNV